VNGTSAPTEGGFGSGLPGWLRPREEVRPGTGQTRLVETTVLVLVGLLLAVATINDVGRQTHVNHRLVADLRTWRAYTGHNYRNLSVEQNQSGRGTRETPQVSTYHKGGVFSVWTIACRVAPRLAWNT
jgi:hypothetical protein